jgi:hypothetical protein
MRKRIAAVLAMVFLLAGTGVARQSGQNGAAAPSSSAKVVTLRGAVGDSGKTLACENDKTVWTVLNPEMLAENAGNHVSIRARMDAAKHALRVVAVRFPPSAGVILSDAAFRR